MNGGEGKPPPKPTWFVVGWTNVLGWLQGCDQLTRTDFWWATAVVTDGDG